MVIVQPRQRQLVRRWVNAIALTLFVLMLLSLRGHILIMAEGVAVIDAEAYWRAELGPDLYQRSPGADGAFLYAPLIAQVYAPFTALPYEAFHALLMVVNASALLWMLGPVLALLSLLFPPVLLELGVGNVHLLIAAAMMAGIRGSAGWYALPLLTKITPGAVVVAYDMLRGDWRRVRWAVGTTLVLVVASAAVAPELWADWIRVLTANDRSMVGINAEFWYIPFPLRLLASAVVVSVAAWRGWPFLLPLAALLALPFVWDHSLSMLVAAWPLWRFSRSGAGTSLPRAGGETRDEGRSAQTGQRHQAQSPLIARDSRG